MGLGLKGLRVQTQMSGLIILAAVSAHGPTTKSGHA